MEEQVELPNAELSRTQVGRARQKCATNRDRAQVVLLLCPRWRRSI